ncbi:MAG: hypothetical protein ABIR70_18500 [Bryobacteraceae bacterium]
MKLENLKYGVAGGLAGGMVFGAMMGMMGMLPMIGQMVGVPSAGVGFLVHLMISALIGATFSVLFGQQVVSRTGGLGYGLMYGAIWWILGPLTLMPLMMGMGVTWSIAAATQAMPSLMGHLIYGGILGWTFARLALHRTHGGELTAH